MVPEGVEICLSKAGELTVLVQGGLTKHSNFRLDKRYSVLLVVSLKIRKAASEQENKGTRGNMCLK